MSEYTVIRGDDHHEVIRKVNEAMRSGWSPIGGFCVAAYDEHANQYFQAMVR